MTIAGIPINLTAQQANQVVLVTWNAVAGATSYSIQRSLDGVNFSSLGTSTLPTYTDSAVTLGTKYYYRAASVNISGTSSYSNIDSAIPAPVAELSLYELRLRSKQMADRVNSQFVTDTEWNSFINRAMFELYDLLITSFEDYFLASPVSFTTTGNTNLYDLPNGTNYNGAPALYKLRGLDLGMASGTNAYVTVYKFNFSDRNRFLYPNTASTQYGVFNVRYRMMGDKIQLIPTPSAGQPMRIWYIPRMTMLLADTDLTTIGISGWLEYVIVRAAKYALDKEESDTTKLDAQIAFLKQRIEETAQNRDAGQPDTISDTVGINLYGYNGRGSAGGFPGGF